MESFKQSELSNDFYGRTIAILGYSRDGREYAQLLKKNQIPVIIGLRLNDEMWTVAEQDGFVVETLWKAVESADIIQVW